MRIKSMMKSCFFMLLVLFALPANAQNWTPLDGTSQSEEELEVRVLSEQAGEIVLEFDIPGISEEEVTTNGQLFTKLSIPGASILTESGKPELPSITKIIEVPAGAQVTAELLEKESIVLDGYSVLPHQVTYDNGEAAPFQIDTTLYSQDLFFPGEEIQVGEEMKMRGHSLVAVTVNPVRYNPVTGQLAARSYFEVVLRYTVMDAVRLSSNTVSSVFENLVAATVVNPQTSVVDRSAATQYDADPGAEYLIIAHDDFYDAQNPTESPLYDLAQHKIQKGLTVKIVTLSEIGANSSADDIRAFIQDAYNNWTQAPVYLLLVGDGEQIPVSSPNYNETDLYYGAVDSSNDFLPDIIVGRFPAKSLAELNVLVDKTISYEGNTNPASWKSRMLTAAYFQDDGDDGKGNRGYLETAEEAHAYLKSIGFDSRAVYTTNSTNPTTYYNGDPIPATLQFTDSTLATGDMIDIINEGVVLGAHRDHGSEVGWSAPILSTDDIADLNNGDMLPLLFGINCLSGRYNDVDGFGEQMVEYAGGGAIGYIGASELSPTYQNHTLYAGLFDCVFPDYRPNYSNANSGSRKMGVIMLHGKMFLFNSDGTGSRSVFEMYNLQGDPELDIDVQVNTGTTYTVETIGHGNGSISPQGIITLNEGEDITLTFTPDEGYYVYRVYVNGGNMGSRESWTIENIQRDTEIEVFFEPRTYFAIQASAGPMGSITPVGEVLVRNGANQTFQITPQDQGHRVKDVLVDGVSVGAVTSFTFANVIRDHTIEATFAVKTYLSTIEIRTSPSEGGITYPGGTVTDKYIGETQELAFLANPGYQIKDVIIDGISFGNISTYTLEITMAYHLVEVEFEPIPSSVCENIVTGGQSGNLDTTEATCFKTQDTINGWGCANMYERTVSVTINGQGTPVTACGAALPSKGADDYYVFEIGAGGVSWASVYWW